MAFVFAVLGAVVGVITVLALLALVFLSIVEGDE